MPSIPNVAVCLLRLTGLGETTAESGRQKRSGYRAINTAVVEIKEELHEQAEAVRFRLEFAGELKRARPSSLRLAPRYTSSRLSPYNDHCCLEAPDSTNVDPTRPTRSGNQRPRQSRNAPHYVPKPRLELAPVGGDTVLPVSPHPGPFSVKNTPPPRSSRQHSREFGELQRQLAIYRISPRHQVPHPRIQIREKGRPTRRGAKPALVVTSACQVATRSVFFDAFPGVSPSCSEFLSAPNIRSDYHRPEDALHSDAPHQPAVGKHCSGEGG